MILFLTLFIITLPKTNQKTTDVTLDVHERVRLLKHEIVKEIESKQGRVVTPIIDDFPDKEYEDFEAKPITPISIYDERKKKNLFKLRPIKTTPDFLGPPFQVPSTQKKVKKDKTTKEKRFQKRARKRKLTTKVTNFIYRRGFDCDLMDSPLDWAHCQDLITPFLKGHKTNVSHVKRVKHKDSVVERLVLLITMNTTESSKDEIYSILYQISNLQIRLFQWDVNAIKYLFKSLIKSERHTFSALKHALKARFAAWSLDVTNTTNLLKQARIFRPPCVQITGYGGSTKLPKGSRHPKPTKKKCTEDDDDEECREP